MKSLPVRRIALILLTTLFVIHAVHAELGEFVPAATIASYLYDPVNIAVADFDEDGREDVVARTRSGGYSLYHNETGIGAMHYELSVLNELGPEGRLSLLTPDMNADGLPDVLACGNADGRIVWWENTGELEFTNHVVDTVNSVQILAVADFNADGYPDILTGGRNGGILIEQQQPDGSFVRSGVVQHLNREVTALQPVDYDGDGDLDILAGWRNPGGVSLLRRDGDEYNEETLATVSEVRAVMLADLDGDADEDIVAMSAARLIAWENLGGGD